MQRHFNHMWMLFFFLLDDWLWQPMFLYASVESIVEQVLCKVHVAVRVKEGASPQYNTLALT